MTSRTTQTVRRKAADNLAVGPAEGGSETGAAAVGRDLEEQSARSELTPDPEPRRLTKAALIQQMLAGPEGATLAALAQATGWQAHTVRAALTRLRQAEHVVERSRSEAGETIYRIGPAAAAAVIPPIGATEPEPVLDGKAGHQAAKSDSAEEGAGAP